MDGAALHRHKGNGLVRDVFEQREMARCAATWASGMPLSDRRLRRRDEAQPFYVNSPYGIALAHNGNLINTDALRVRGVREDRRHINTELRLRSAAERVRARVAAGRAALTRPTCSRDQRRARRCRGGYAVVAMVLGHRLVASAIRTASARWCSASARAEAAPNTLASESVALDHARLQGVRDVAPGEAVFITSAASCTRSQCAPPAQHAPCIFEYVYFARPTR
jgi:amidophosphoribosyltransferase